jgi:hypothetical protein
VVHLGPFFVWALPGLSFFFPLGVKGSGGVFGSRFRASSSLGPFDMRSDLLYAQASLDWALANLPTFEERLNLWLRDNIKTQIQYTDADSPNDIIIAVEKSPFPLAFSAEAGALLNSMRSALDVLAFAIHERNPRCKPGDVCFPIAPNKTIWDSKKGFKGSEFIASLDSAEGGIFETLNPYGGEGGNFALYCLHRLDITRKHKRLLAVSHVPAKLTLIGDFKRTEFKPVLNDSGFIEVAGSRETILGLWAKSAAKPKIGYAPEVLVTDSALGLEAPIMPMLGEFTRQVEAVIKLFDYP